MGDTAQELVELCRAKELVELCRKSKWKEALKLVAQTTGSAFVDYVHKPTGRTVLFYAAEKSGGSQVVTELLLHKQAPSVLTVNNWGNTALHVACMHGQVKNVEAILQACKAKEEDLCTRLLEFCSNQGARPIDMLFPPFVDPSVPQREVDAVHEFLLLQLVEHKLPITFADVAAALQNHSKFSDTLLKAYLASGATVKIQADRLGVLDIGVARQLQNAMGGMKRLIEALPNGQHPSIMTSGNEEELCKRFEQQKMRVFDPKRGPTRVRTIADAFAVLSMILDDTASQLRRVEVGTLAHLAYSSENYDALSHLARAGASMLLESSTKTTIPSQFVEVKEDDANPPAAAPVNVGKWLHRAQVPMYGAGERLPPVQVAINIHWLLGRIAQLGQTPRERRAQYDKVLVESPFLLPTMHVLGGDRLEKIGHIPRSDIVKDQTTNVMELDDDESVVCFVSHRWLRPAEGNPDTNDGHRFKQLIEFMKWRNLHPSKIYFWFDFFSIEQDDRVIQASGIHALPLFVSMCDEFIYFNEELYSTRAFCRLEQLAWHHSNSTQGTTNNNYHITCFEPAQAQFESRAIEMSSMSTDELRFGPMGDPAKANLTFEGDRGSVILLRSLLASSSSSSSSLSATSLTTASLTDDSTADSQPDVLKALKTLKQQVHGEEEGAAAAMADMLWKGDGLSKAVIGQNLASAQLMEVCMLYFTRFDFTGQTITEAITEMLIHFQLPGEAQTIDRLLSSFASRYSDCNPDSGYHDQDAVLIMAFGALMLNTDMRNTNVTPDRRMTLENFRNNLRGSNDGQDFDDDLIADVYRSIQAKPLGVREARKNEEPRAPRAGCCIIV